jgi:hypothetical protein
MGTGSLSAIAALMREAAFELHQHTISMDEYGFDCAFCDVGGDTNSGPLHQESCLIRRLKDAAGDEWNEALNAVVDGMREHELEVPRVFYGLFR